MKTLFYYIISISVLIVSCAQQSSLSGGVKDIEAPQVDNEHTFPKNESTNFDLNEISISFNEFIRLKNPEQNVIVTPSLKVKPLFELRGKKVTIRFQEELDPKTTYTINFGNSISDLTEGNKLLNYSYVFSTGDILDSLTIKGSVYDAFYKTTKGKVLVGLYQSSDDSVGLNDAPYYFTKTTINGSYEFHNLKEGKYTLLAIEDENNNLKYDRFTESVAFLDSSIQVSNDTLMKNYNLSFFKEEQSENWIVTKNYRHPGEVTISLNKKSAVVTLELLNNTFTNGKIKQTFINTDSIHFWVSKIDSVTTIQFVAQLEEQVLDTITLKVKTPKLIKDTILRFKTNVANDLPYFEPIKLTFKTPIKEVNKDQIRIVNEDYITVPFEVTFVSNEVTIKAKFEEDEAYELFLNPDSFSDKYNKVNDSAHLFFSVIPADKYGSIVLHYEREETQNQQIIQLIKEGNVIKEFVVSKKHQTEEFKNLIPGNYQLKAINDSNNNGKWDTGNYLLKQQPELVKLFEDKIELIAGWDLDLTWKN